MNQINRFCIQLGHQQFQVEHICTYRWCYMPRWCCSKCLSDRIHGHQKTDQNHIMNQASLSTQVKQDIENLQQANQIKKLLSQLLKKSQQLEKLMIAFRQNVERQLNNLISDYDNFKLQSLIKKIEGSKFNQLDDDDINRLLNINQYQLNYEIKSRLLDPVDKIQYKLNIISQKVKDYEKNTSNKIIYFKSRKYDVQKIYNGYRYYDQQPILSNNERYLVYNIQKLIHIYDIRFNKIYKSINLKDNIFTLQFTQNSKYLFAGDVRGFVFGFMVFNEFKKVYQQKIHEDLTYQIIVQKQYLITCSQDKTIIKTDFITKKQIFKLVGHLSRVWSMDYDYQKDIIIGAEEYSIKVWDCSNQSVLINQDSVQSQTKQVQLINDKQNLLVLYSNGNLLKFKIDYNNKYQQNQGIVGFYQANNDQYLLLICDVYCKILNNNGELTNTIEHNLSLNSYTPGSYNNNNQLDNLKYIIIYDGRQHYEGYKTINLLRVQNQN